MLPTGSEVLIKSRNLVRPNVFTVCGSPSAQLGEGTNNDTGRGVGLGGGHDTAFSVCFDSLLVLHSLLLDLYVLCSHLVVELLLAGTKETRVELHRFQPSILAFVPGRCFYRAPLEQYFHSSTKVL